MASGSNGAVLRQIERRAHGKQPAEEPSLELEPFLVLRESTAPPRR